MRTQLLAFAAVAAAVLAAWEAVCAVTELLPRVLRLAAPLRGERAPRDDERRQLIVLGWLSAVAGGWLLAGPLLAFAAGAVAPVALRRWFVVQAARRRDHLVAAAPGVARTIADALAGGSSIRAAVAGAHAGVIDGVARRELLALDRSLELGVRTDDVLERLRASVGAPAYDAIVAAILLQREAGGDLAALLRRLAATIEADARADRDARAATAQARFSAGLVVWLPAAVAGIAELAAPGSVRVLLATPLSATLAGCAAALQVTGWLLIRRVCAIAR